MAPSAYLETTNLADNVQPLIIAPEERNTTEGLTQMLSEITSRLNTMASNSSNPDDRLNYAILEKSFDTIHQNVTDNETFRNCALRSILWVDLEEKKALVIPIQSSQDRIVNLAIIISTEPDNNIYFRQIEIPSYREGFENTSVDKSFDYTEHLFDELMRPAGQVFSPSDVYKLLIRGDTWHTVKELGQSETPLYNSPKLKTEYLAREASKKIEVAISSAMEEND